MGIAAEGKERKELCRGAKGEDAACIRGDCSRGKDGGEVCEERAEAGKGSNTWEEVKEEVEKHTLGQNHAYHDDHHGEDLEGKEYQRMLVGRPHENMVRVLERSLERHHHHKRIHRQRMIHHQDLRQHLSQKQPRPEHRHDSHLIPTHTPHTRPTHVNQR